MAQHMMAVSPGNDWALQNVTTYEEAIKSDGRHAAHCMIFARSDRRVLHNGRYPEKAQVLMQMRCDGCIGFPGGFIEPGETLMDGLKRELKEEANIDPAALDISAKRHWVCSAVRYVQWQPVVNHFFAVEVSPEQFEEIYNMSGGRSDDEVRGHIRVPLYTMMEENHLGQGLPLFLDNVFAGFARPQLLISIVKVGILSQMEMESAMGFAKTRPISITGLL